MKSQLEWSHKKFIKFEMKKGRSRKENKEFLKQGFPNGIEKCRGVGNFTWRNFGHSVVLSFCR